MSHTLAQLHIRFVSVAFHYGTGTHVTHTGTTSHSFCFRSISQLCIGVSSSLLLRLLQVPRCDLLTESVDAYMLCIFLGASLQDEL
jgi:hypothetical protein